MKIERKIVETVKRYAIPISLIPMLIGTIGYILAGVRLRDSLYYSFSLYFTNLVDADKYNCWIGAARWLAPLVTATAILSTIKTVWKNLRWHLRLLGRKETVAVYSDEDIRIAFKENVKEIYPGDEFKGYAKEHIIMFSSDEKNMQFYKEHETQLEKIRKKNVHRNTVYMGLRDLELGNMKNLKGVALFDVNGSIARELWKEIALWEKQRNQWKIVIYGSNVLAQTVISTALQYNLFSTAQKIEYTIISKKPYFKEKHPGLDLMNGDTLRYCSDKDKKKWDAIKKADMVIITEELPLSMLQAILFRAARGKVYYYTPKEGSASEYLAFDNLKSFGREEKVLTDENIRKELLIENAKTLNEQYAKAYNKDCQSRDEEWEKLTGFLKASNISAADYGEVIKSLAKLDESVISEEELAKLEHIRWCRFHFLNFWKKGDPKNGARKDTVKRIHKDLVCFKRLEEEEKEKDREIIRMWKKQMQES